MATERRRRRHRTIGGVMVGIALLALLMMLARPVLRRGWPTCMSTPTAVRWLVARPASASCTECHADVRVAAAPVSVPAAGGGPCGPGRALGNANPKSCLGCHTAVPAAAPAGRRPGLDPAIWRSFTEG